MLTMLPNGTIVRSRYLVERLLGQGRAGGVYVVKDLQSKQKRFAFFVLKELIHADRQVRHRVSLDAVPLTRLHHPGLVRVLQSLNDDSYERVYVVMSYVEGVNFEVLCQQEPEKRLSFEKVLLLMMPILDAVMYLHQQTPPVIHQNIAPAAMIFAKETGRSTLVNLALPGEVIPKVVPDFEQLSSYEAPELYSDGPDAMTDVYSLGATFYTLLTGTLPSDAFYRSALLESEKRDPLVPLRTRAPGVSAGVAEVIQRALAIDRQERYASVEQFVKALKLANTGSLPDTVFAANGRMALHAVAGDGVKTAAKGTRRSGGWKWMVGVVALCLLLIGGFVAYALNSPAAAHRATGGQSTASVVQTPSPGVTSSVGPSITSLNGYPQLGNSYAGTIFDQAGTIKTNMFLTNVQQDRGALRGNFFGLHMDGPFLGTIDRGGNLRITVTDKAGRAILFLEGGVQSSTSLSGDYYLCGNKAGGPCERLSGGGIWNALANM